MTPGYRGRFAPSPTGLLHLGSLLAAVASWLDARAAGGHWLVRMEDLDRPRVVPGAAETILATLARFGLVSDEPVLWQSARGPAYSAALRTLADQGLAYRCRCSRSEVPGIYPGTCRDLGIQDADSAWRLRMDEAAPVTFEDRLQGHMACSAATLGDPVLFRRDGLAAYQLAVVVDDAHQRITDVVRGADLLESTAWQIAIARALRLPSPRYAHVPSLTEPDGTKLAKSRRSQAVAQMPADAALRMVLGLLELPVATLPPAVKVDDMLRWAVQHWLPGQLSGVREIPLSP
jgi:glutamyl-Q tRNA(Asp) synthetase